MGQRHNRRRTRSRQRSRAATPVVVNAGIGGWYIPMRATHQESPAPRPTQSQYQAYPPTLRRHHRPDTGTLSSCGSPSSPLSNGVHGSTTSWQREAVRNEPDDESPTAKHRKRLFGSDGGDEEGALCAPMLQVVLDLFDSVDYEDP